MSQPLLFTDVLIGFVAVGEPNTFPATENGATVDDVTKLYRRIFPGNSRLLGEVRLCQNSPTHANWSLSTGKTFATPVSLYHVNLPFGYLGIVGSCHLTTPLNTDETIEMLSLLRGTSDTVADDTPSKYHLSDVLENDRGSFSGLLTRHYQGNYTIVPVVYVRSFDPHLGTAQELLRTYTAELGALRSLSIAQSDLIKRQHLRALTADDVHPFTYGVTFFSPICTIELHPSNTHVIAEREGLTLEEHHLREWAFLTGLLTVIVLARASMEADSLELDRLLDAHHSRNILRGLTTLRRLSLRRRAIAKRLHIYATIDLARREYMMGILDRARLAFGLENVYRTIRAKLEDVSADINSIYNGYLSFATLALAAIAAVLTAVTVYQGFIKGP